MKTLPFLKNSEGLRSAKCRTKDQLQMQEISKQVNVQRVWYFIKLSSKTERVINNH